MIWLYVSEGSTSVFNTIYKLMHLLQEKKTKNIFKSFFRGNLLLKIFEYMKSTNIQDMYPQLLYQFFFYSVKLEFLFLIYIFSFNFLMQYFSDYTIFVFFMEGTSRGRQRQKRRFHRANWFIRKSTVTGISSLIKSINIFCGLDINYKLKMQNIYYKYYQIIYIGLINILGQQAKLFYIFFAAM